MKRRSLAYLLLLGTIGATATVASPGFDCDKARTSAERMLCQDQGLASLDRETDRLYRLARDGQFTTRQQRKELQLAQRRWIKRRDDCWKVPGRQCLRDRYVTRIHALRTYYADARRADAQGISAGPLVLACQGFDSLIGLTFIGHQRDIAFIEWRNLAHAYVLERERGGPGVTYTGSSAEGAAVFRTNGDRAQLQLSDQMTMECRIEAPG
jgi:uncharacterized protein